MKLKDLKIEELELLSYTDITSMLLKEKGKSMNTPSIFREICDLLGFSDEEYADKIGDYYTSLTIDKRFVLLENHEWDLRERHAVEIVMDDEDEEDTEESIDEEVEQEEEENIEEAIDDEDLDDVDDDMEDLSIVTDDEDEEDDM